MSRDIEAKIQNKLSFLRNTEKPRHIYKRISFAITRKCPLECRRCYFCGSKNGESIDLRSARKIIENLPNDLEGILITGGEPFTELSLVFGILKALKERKSPELGQIGIFTTGFWVKDKSYTRRICKKLIELGVNYFVIGSFDRWHYEAGLKREKPEFLLNTLKNDLGAIEVTRSKNKNEDILKRVFAFNTKLYVVPMADDTAFPIGRAMWAIKNEEKTIIPEPLFMCRDFLNIKYGYDYVINFNGEYHFCLNCIAKPMGNIIEERFESILKRAKENILFSRIHQGDIATFAKEYFNLSKEETKRQLEKWGTCGFCTHLFIEYFKDRDDKPIMHKIYEIEKSKYKRESS